jgi:hypothetical protein
MVLGSSSRCEWPNTLNWLATRTYSSTNNTWNSTFCQRGVKDIDPSMYLSSTSARPPKRRYRESNREENLEGPKHTKTRSPWPFNINPCITSHNVHITAWPYRRCKDRCRGEVLRLGLPSSIAAGREACCGQGDAGEVGSEERSELRRGAI